MKRMIILAAVMMLAPLAASPVFAGDAPASSPSAAYSTNSTPLGMMLDNPAAKAVLVKYIPAMIASPQIDMARSMTLKQMQSYAPDQLSDATLGKIDADLANVPAAAPTPPGK